MCDEIKIVYIVKLERKPGGQKDGVGKKVGKREPKGEMKEYLGQKCISEHVFHCVRILYKAV